MKGKFFSHIIVNVVLVALVLCISAVSLFGSAANVFHGQDYSPVYRGQSSDKVCDDKRLLGNGIFGRIFGNL